MGAIRLNFKKGRDDWEYGYITLLTLMGACLIQHPKKQELWLLKYSDHPALQELPRQLYAGKVELNHFLTICFIQATDLLSKFLISDREEDKLNLFSFVTRYSTRFKNLSTFETYYLAYSTKLMTFTKNEFDKEPALRGKLDRLLNP